MRDKCEVCFLGVASNPFRFRADYTRRSVCFQNAPTYIKVYSVPLARGRNPGGFSKPSIIPDDLQKLRRAVELLGNATQRKVTSSLETKLIEYVGQVPKNRLIAQQWKGSLTLILKDRTGRRSTRFANKTKIHFEQLVLPKDDSKRDRALSLLERCRKRFVLGDCIHDKAMAELKSIICCVPSTSEEAFKAIKTLSRLSKVRRSGERRPLQIPNTDSDLQEAYCLLGTAARARSLGSQEARLLELLGSLPRTRYVALWWKKAVGTVIRKRKRKWETAQRRLRIEMLRAERRAKKQRWAREHAQSLELTPSRRR